MRQAFTTYHISFDTPIHIGDYKPFEYGASLRHIPSDTFIAALMAVRAVYGLDLPEDGDPGFAISSLFPFMAEESKEPAYFFPKPITGLSIPDGKVEWVKKLKKVAWMDVHYFSRSLSGEVIRDFGGNDCDHIVGAFLSNRFKIDNSSRDDTHIVFESQVAERVSLPRVRQSEQDNNLFSMERLYFKENAGLYFLFYGNEENRQWLEESLQLLAMEGIGTDRNVGHGTFSWNKGELTLELSEKANHIIAMGLYHPEDPETLQTMIDENSAWRLVKRGGWITDPQYQSIRKRSVYMFSEGSVFKQPEDGGSRIGTPNINLQPRVEDDEYPVDHPIWRCGRSLVLPIKLN